MIRFVNAKINIGLQIVNRRSDGYHDLQTLFYPVGVHAGAASNPEAFCDVLEITPVESKERFTLVITGNQVDCPLERNLVWRAAELFFTAFPDCGLSVAIRLDKHLPDGAGMGGGSADASFTLAMLAELVKVTSGRGQIPSIEQLSEMALSLGADCPFFLLNRPSYAEGVGERLSPVNLDLRGKWLLVAKPDVSISTREAFSGVVPEPACFDLRELLSLPIEQWREVVRNDFEDSIFPHHTQFVEIKGAMYDSGAQYASLTGSGSCIYGIFANRDTATLARTKMKTIPTVSTTYLLEL